MRYTIYFKLYSPADEERADWQTTSVDASTAKEAQQQIVDEFHEPGYYIEFGDIFPEYDDVASD